MGKEMLWMGYVFAAIAAASLIAFFICLGKESSVIRYRKKGKTNHSPQFIKEMSLAYEAGGSIRQMLYLMERTCRQKAVRQDIRDAIHYLEHSRYKDYETALACLSDGSREYQELCRELIRKEAAKHRRLPMKQRKQNKN